MLADLDQEARDNACRHICPLPAQLLKARLLQSQYYALRTPLNRAAHMLYPCCSITDRFTNIPNDLHPQILVAASKSRFANTCQINNTQAPLNPPTKSIPESTTRPSGASRLPRTSHPRHASLEAMMIRAYRLAAVYPPAVTDIRRNALKAQWRAATARCELE